MLLGFCTLFRLIFLFTFAINGLANVIRNELLNQRIIKAPPPHYLRDFYLQPQAINYQRWYYYDGGIRSNYYNSNPYKYVQKLNPGIFYKRNYISNQLPSKMNRNYAVAQRIHDLTTWINSYIGDQGLGFGTNGTQGLIGDINEIINDVGEIFIDIIQFKLTFLQHVLDKSEKLLSPLSFIMEKLDNFAAKAEEFATVKFGPVYGDFARNFHLCMRKSIQCHFLPIFSKLCLVHCALSAIPDATPMHIFVDFVSNVIEKFLQIFCNPIQTIFHLSWKFYMKHMASLSMTSLLENIGSMGLNMEELIGEQVQIWFPRTMTRILTPLRTTFNTFDFAIEGIENGILPLVKKFNPACWILDVKLAPVRFMELFDYKPRMIDTLLGGVILVATLVQGLPGSERIRAKEVYKVIDVMTGLNCGVIGWSNTNGSAICEQRAGLVKKGR